MNEQEQKHLDTVIKLYEIEIKKFKRELKECNKERIHWYTKCLELNIKAGVQKK